MSRDAVSLGLARASYWGSENQPGEHQISCPECTFGIRFGDGRSSSQWITSVRNDVCESRHTRFPAIAGGAHCNLVQPSSASLVAATRAHRRQRRALGREQVPRAQPPPRFVAFGGYRVSDLLDRGRAGDQQRAAQLAVRDGRLSRVAPTLFLLRSPQRLVVVIKHAERPLQQRLNLLHHHKHLLAPAKLGNERTVN